MFNTSLNKEVTKQINHPVSLLTIDTIELSVSILFFCIQCGYCCATLTFTISLPIFLISNFAVLAIFIFLQLSYTESDLFILFICGISFATWSRLLGAFYPEISLLAAYLFPDSMCMLMFGLRPKRNAVNTWSQLPRGDTFKRFGLSDKNSPELAYSSATSSWYKSFSKYIANWLKTKEVFFAIQDLLICTCSVSLNHV